MDEEFLKREIKEIIDIKSLMNVYWDHWIGAVRESEVGLGEGID